MNSPLHFTLMGDCFQVDFLIATAAETTFLPVPLDAPSSTVPFGADSQGSFGFSHTSSRPSGTNPRQPHSQPTVHVKTEAAPPSVKVENDVFFDGKSDVFFDDFFDAFYDQSGTLNVKDTDEYFPASPPMPHFRIPKSIGTGDAVDEEWLSDSEEIYPSSQYTTA